MEANQQNDLALLLSRDNCKNYHRRLETAVNWLVWWMDVIKSLGIIRCFLIRISSFSIYPRGPVQLPSHGLLQIVPFYHQPIPGLGTQDFWVHLWRFQIVISCNIFYWEPGVWQASVCYIARDIDWLGPGRGKKNSVLVECCPLILFKGLPDQWMDWDHLMIQKMGNMVRTSFQNLSYSTDKVKTPQSCIYCTCTSVSPAGILIPTFQVVMRI